MKRFLMVLAMVWVSGIGAQTNDALIKHFEAYGKQMRTQGDVQGIINAMTHLNVLAPSEARKDTLAYIYMSEGQYMQALNTIGIDRKIDDSDIAVEVKAMSLKAVKQPERALAHFDEMFKRNPSPELAYELAELNMQLQKLDAALTHINYGIANAKPDMKRAYYEQQQPYQVDLKSAFMYLKALHLFQQDREKNIDAAVDILDDTLKASPNFNLVNLSKTELLRQKQMLQAQAAKPKE
ncbi:MAG: tetratricopeptide repeat protein [Jejuia sp.]